MTSIDGLACGPRIWRRLTLMPPARTRAEATGLRAAGTATDGIGTQCLTPIHSSRAMEFSTIRSAGASTPRALRSELHTSGTATVTPVSTAAAVTIILDQATVPAT